MWYGKLGTLVAAARVALVLGQDAPRILLVHSGRADRWRAHIDAISRMAPDSGYPAYHGSGASKVRCWPRVTVIEPTGRGVISPSRCYLNPRTSRQTGIAGLGLGLVLHERVFRARARCMPPSGACR